MTQSTPLGNLKQTSHVSFTGAAMVVNVRCSLYIVLKYGQL